jgi:hypothetical protein
MASSPSRDPAARISTNADQRLVDSHLELMKRALSASLYDESAWIRVEPRRPPIVDLRRPLRYSRALLRWALLRDLQRRSIVAARARRFDETIRAEGRDWPAFGYTMIGHRRLDNVRCCVEDVLRDGVPGDLLEAGVWRGGTTIFMRAILAAYGVTDRTVWVADSFEGLPVPASESDGADFSGIPILAVSLDQVRANFERFGLLDEQVGFLRGWFADTLPRAPIERLAVLRLDGDLYSSTMDTLQSLYDKVSAGGYVIVDDYHSWESCRRAVTDFLASRSLRPEIHTIDWAGAYWRVD